MSPNPFFSLDIFYKLELLEVVPIFMSFNHFFSLLYIIKCRWRHGCCFVCILFTFWFSLKYYGLDLREVVPMFMYLIHLLFSLLYFKLELHEVVLYVFDSSLFSLRYLS